MRRFLHPGNTGKGLENRMATMARIYDQRGILTLEKVDPPTYMRKVGNQWVAMHAPSPFLDFVGCVKCASGRALFIEAKSSDEPRLPFGGASGGVTSTQFANLNRWRSAGAITGVLFEYRGGSELEFYWADAPEFRAANEDGRKSIPISGMERVPAGVSLIADFWQIIRRRHFPNHAEVEV